MLTEEDDVEIHALNARGWTVAAISRHTGVNGPRSEDDPQVLGPSGRGGSRASSELSATVLSITGDSYRMRAHRDAVAS